MKFLLLGSFAFTLFNTGLIWIVQVVHYPSFLRIGKEMYQTFQNFHMRANTYIVGPSMLAKLAFSGLIIFGLHQLQNYKLLYIISLFLLAGIWIHTALWAVPLHNKLLGGFNEEAIQNLVNANWWRTIFWTARAVIMGFIVYGLFKF
jgi:hypothetical protein